MSTLIMKFGGSSVGMTMGLTQVLSIVLYEQEHWDRLLLVVSALEGVTDALIEASRLAQLNNRRGYRRIVANIRMRHLALVEHLPLGANERSALQADIDRLLFDMLAQCQMLSDNADDEAQSEAIDSIIGVGERLAARIVAGLLRQNNLRGVAIDATDLIITDNVYGHATPNLNLSRDRIAHNLLPMLDRGIIPVITGFIGSTTAGKPTTLGRGGSDYTASVLAVCTDADEVWIWTDVDGMMTTDPRQINDARLIPTLTYDEVAELAYFGARILHPRMIGPLRDRQIPLRVRNVFKPQHSGSLIVPDNKKNASPPALKAVTTIHGLGLLAEHSGPLSRVTAVVDDALFDITGSHADVMISAQSSSKTLACFVIPTSAGPDALHSLEVELEQRLREVADEPDWSTRPLTIVTAIGARLNEQHPLVARTLEALEDIRVWALSQGPAHCSLSMVVEPKDADAALRQIHDLILRTDSGTDPAPKA